MIKRNRLYILSFLFAAVTVLPWGFIQPRILDDVRNFAFDSYQRLYPRTINPNLPIRIISIDEESLSAYGQWPWSRSLLSDLTAQLRDLGAKVIVYDFIFAEQDQLNLRKYVNKYIDPKIKKQVEQIISKIPNPDDSFIRSINSAPTVLGVVGANVDRINYKPKAGFVTLGDDPKQLLIRFDSIISPFSQLSQVSKGLGATNWIPDHDQVIRSIPLMLVANDEYLPSLSLEAIRIAQQALTYVIISSNASGQTALGMKTGVNKIKIGDIEIQTGKNGEIRPKYSYTSPEIIISAKKVLEGKLSKLILKDCIVFVGARSVGLGDVRATPLEPVIYGVDVHAQLVEAVLSGQLLVRPDWCVGAELLISIVSFSITLLFLFFSRPIIAAAVGPILVVLFVTSSMVFYKYWSLLLDPIYPSFVVLGGYVTGAIALWRTESYAKQQIRSAFGKYVAPNIVDQIAKNPDSLVLGGETRNLSILFCDMRNFTSISEKLSAQELSVFINNYFTPLSDAIIKFNGTIDKYIGDAVLAFWNAPLLIDNHQVLACKSALLMRHELKCLNIIRQSNSLRPIDFGVGIHSGLCSVGNMGSEKRFDYSILGDSVNLTARLEGACKFFSTDILATREIYDSVRDFAWLKLGYVQLLGKSELKEVYVLVGDNNIRKSAHFDHWSQLHDEMISYYNNQDPLGAKEIALELIRICDDNWAPMYGMLYNEFSGIISRNDDIYDPIWRPTK